MQKFESNLVKNLLNLHWQLKAKFYEHSDYFSFYINDPKLRKIHKACVGDRVLHHAIFIILYPIFDKQFIFDSYSCRNNKGTHRAINRLDYFIRKTSRNNYRNCFVLKCDVKKFFDSINQDVLINLIKRKIRDDNAIWLILKVVKSFLKGLPLGNITSQLFANIYLNELDKFAKHNLRIKHYIRYCDDFVIVSENKSYLLKIIPLMAKFLSKNLQLSMHPDKIIIRKNGQGMDFLGYVVFPNHKILRIKTKRRIFRAIKKAKIEYNKGRLKAISFEQKMQSYLGVLKHCDGNKIKEKLADIGSPTIL